MQIIKRLAAAFLFVAGLAVCVSSNAYAYVITRCGSSLGMTYTFHGGLRTEPSGWDKDGIKDSYMSLISDYGQLDISYNDSGNAGSVRGDGGVVRVLKDIPSEGVFVIVVEYPNAMEHYYFRLDKTGVGEVIWGGLKWTGLANSSGIYRAACEAPK